MKTLTVRLTELETIIENGLQTFVEVGEALAIIRDEKLYKVEFKTFEEYCRERWNISPQHGRRLINAVDTVKQLEPTGSILPQTERQTRPLTKLLPQQQTEAWQQALESSNGKPTAKDVEEAVITVKKTHVVKNYYTVSEWEKLDEAIKSLLLSKNGNHTFNQTNDNIEWARYSWNPITGCLHNCSYCYARDIASRFYPQGFEPSFLPERLAAPQNTKQKDLNKFNNRVDRIGYRNVFTCSMADLFGKWVPKEWIEAVLKQVRNNPQWTFLFLTKFPIRMADFDYPENVWLGTTVDKQHAIERAEKAFRKIKASGFNGVCWLSCEPMLERLTFSTLNMFDWIVIGGSSKSTQTEEFRPPREWVNYLESQAIEAGCKIYEKTNLWERVREYPIDL